MTAIVSAIVMASSWSCVTCTKVMPTSCWMRLSSICSCLRRRRSSAPSGSSSSSARGRLTSARASATRCCWPPESWPGLRLAEAAELDELERLADARADLVLGDLLALEAEGDVALDAQVREQRVGLEDRVDVALVRRVVGDVVAAEAARGPRSGPRSRRSSAASSSCRSPTGPSIAKNAPRSIVSVRSSTATRVAEALRHARPARMSGRGVVEWAAGSHQPA